MRINPNSNSSDHGSRTALHVSVLLGVYIFYPAKSSTINRAHVNFNEAHILLIHYNPNVNVKKHCAFEALFQNALSAIPEMSLQCQSMPSSMIVFW